MLDKIKKLKERYQNTESEKDISEIRDEMRKLFKDNPDEFAESMVECMKETNRKAGELILKQKMKDICL